MTRYEIIKLNEQLFRLLNDNGIDTKDLNYLPMVEEFRKMKSKKHKVNYIVAYLSNKYVLPSVAFTRLLNVLEKE